MKKIPLSRGKFALVDDADFEVLSKHSWYADLVRGKFYARRAIPLPGGKQKKINMHSVLCPVAPGFCVDHENRDTLDNQRKNLRVATRRQNRMNCCRMAKKKTSRFKGVFRSRDEIGGCVYSYWRASIGANNKNIYLGNFPSEEAAARAYDQAARKLHGAFASINFPDNKTSKKGSCARLS